MFQTFQATTRPDQGPPRLAALRAEMAGDGLAGFLVPRADRFQGEYVAACDDRLAWLTGFTGSAGFCAVLAKDAGVFIDGRYRIQVKSQVDTAHFSPVPWPENGLADWLTEHLPGGGVVGYDPWLHAVREIEALQTALGADSAITLRPVGNLVDRIWADRPAPPANPIEVYPDAMAGRTAAEKRADIAGKRAVILTLPDSICWLLNIRGSDIPRNPLVQSFAVLYPDATLHLFTDATADAAALAHLGDAVTRHPLDALPDHLAQARDCGFQIDPASAPMAILRQLEGLAAQGVTVARAPDPCVLPKACKTEAEIANSREAHLRDGAAMVEFLAWLDDQPPGSLTEIAVVKALEGFRRATNALREISFDTIAGAGANGAIVHYRVTDETDRDVRAGDLLLVDSGGQYLDGTTDITRTMAVGTPPPGAIDAFTRVLSGMIALSVARFPRGVTGAHIDALARAPLWRAGMDYDHGTGHGVGAYLCVHEGPARISRVSDIALAPGMILSNEPGYYREGAFGIRIENLITVTPAPEGPDGRDMLAFETLTYVPIDRRLIDAGALAPWERDWLNLYHAETRARIAPRLSDDARRWLEQATAPL